MIPVGLLAGYPPDALFVKAFEKNYKTPSKPGVVSNYGFKRQHAEPIELVGYNFECIFDRACEAEVNRYRQGHSKNYESSRYVDLLRHGLTVVIPDDVETEKEKAEFLEADVLHSFYRYAKLISEGKKRQDSRRRIGTYQAVESVHFINTRTLYHMARQRSAELSPNGKEAEPQIGDVVTQMVKSVLPYHPVFADDILSEIKKGYR